MKCLKCQLIFSNFSKLLSHYSLAHPEAYEYICDHNIKPILLKLGKGNTRIKISSRRFDELQSLGLVCDNLYCTRGSELHINYNVPTSVPKENPWRNILSYKKASEACDIKGSSKSVKSKNFKKTFLING